MKITSEELSLLNKFIRAVYEHGGDRGGTYDSNTKGVQEAMNAFQEKIDNIVFTYYKDTYGDIEQCPILVEKINAFYNR